MTVTAPRIAPLDPPYEPELAIALAQWMPPGTPVPPLALFRTIARHPMLRERMRPLGNGLLFGGTLPARVRELLILRTCARCDARYEWTVHATAFAAAAGLDPTVVAMTAATRPELADGDALTVRVADELHDSATLSDATFAAAVEQLGAPAMLEVAAICGFYHLIAYLIGVAGVAREPWAMRFPGEPA